MGVCVGAGEGGTADHSPLIGLKGRQQAVQQYVTDHSLKKELDTGPFQKYLTRIYEEVNKAADREEETSEEIWDNRD